MIRIGTKEDIPNILEVVQDAKELFRLQGSTQWQDANGYPNRETFLQDLRMNQVLVLEKDSILCAVAVVTKDQEEAYEIIYDGKWLSNVPYIAVHRIAVRKSHYHQGLAKALLTEAENIARKQGVSSIKVDTHEKNMPMLGLLSSLGYTYCGIIYLPRGPIEDKKRLAFEKIIV